MEVHAHTHPSPGPGHRKKWTHYLWEFLMLFLAVFCGFLAENLREHKVEKERGRQYIISFIEDLRTDTANITLQIEDLESKGSVLNGIFTCFDSVTGKAMSPECLRKIIPNARGFVDFIYTDRTIQQLKYSGGLRLIQDKEISDSIMKYDASVRQLLIHQEALENQQQITINAHNSMIGFIQLQQLNKPAADNDLFLLTNDKRELNKYFNEIATFKRGCHVQLSRLQKLIATATHILVFLDKKGY